MEDENEIDGIDGIDGDDPSGDPVAQWVPDDNGIETAVGVKRIDVVGDGLRLHRHIRIGKSAHGSLVVETSEYLNGSYLIASGRVSASVDAETAKEMVRRLAQIFGV